MSYKAVGVLVMGVRRVDGITLIARLHSQRHTSTNRELITLASLTATIPQRPDSTPLSNDPLSLFRYEIWVTMFLLPSRSKLRGIVCSAEELRSVDRKGFLGEECRLDRWEGVIVS